MDSQNGGLTPDTQNRRSRNQWQLGLKLLLGIGLIALVISFVDFRELVDIVANANVWYLLALIVLFYVDRALMAYKWSQLLRVVAIKIPFVHLLQIYIVVPLSGIVLPSTIGGDLFRLYTLSKYKVSKKAVLASMAVERLTAVAATLVLASIGLGLAFSFLKDDWSQFRGIAWTMTVGFLVTVGIILGITQPVFWKSASKLVTWGSKYPIIGRLTSKLHEIYTLCYGYRDDPRTVMKVSGWTLLEQLAPVVENFFMAYALHIDVSFLELMAIIPILVLAIRLPISLDGLGVQEGLYVGLFALVGVSASEAFLLSLVSRVLPLLAALPWGIHYVLRNRQSISLADKSPG